MADHAARTDAALSKGAPGLGKGDATGDFARSNRRDIVRLAGSDALAAAFAAAVDPAVIREDPELFAAFAGMPSGGTSMAVTTYAANTAHAIVAPPGLKDGDTWGLNIFTGPTAEKCTAYFADYFSAPGTVTGSIGPILDQQARGSNAHSTQHTCGALTVITAPTGSPLGFSLDDARSFDPSDSSSLMTGIGITDCTTSDGDPRNDRGDGPIMFCGASFNVQYEGPPFYRSGGVTTGGTGATIVEMSARTPLGVDPAPFRVHMNMTGPANTDEATANPNAGRVSVDDGAYMVLPPSDVSDYRYHLPSADRRFTGVGAYRPGTLPSGTPSLRSLVGRGFYAGNTRYVSGAGLTAMTHPFPFDAKYYMATGLHKSAVVYVTLTVICATPAVASMGRASLAAKRGPGLSVATLEQISRALVSMPVYAPVTANWSGALLRGVLDVAKAAAPHVMRAVAPKATKVIEEIVREPRGEKAKGKDDRKGAAKAPKRASKSATRAKR